MDALKHPTINTSIYINNDFFGKWQIDAFWLNAASGSYSICYGAHGIWNVGDGQFLAQWGKQTFKEAMLLETPQILGKAYKLLLDYGVFDWNDISINLVDDEVNSITRMSKDGKKLIYIPDISKCKEVPCGRYLDVETVEFINKPPLEGSIVVFN